MNTSRARPWQTDRTQRFVASGVPHGAYRLRMPNRLAAATSPYLLQHAENPVDWYEWGPQAFEAAASRDVPVLLSVGYATCHWCHVMAHESFEHDETAQMMNENFVNVKVDREERPDVDRIYMDAVTAMTGRGGWPMTVFLTPDQRPIYAGTYFPRERRGGHPSFREVMAAVLDAWNANRPGIEQQAETIRQAIASTGPPAGPEPTEHDLAEAVRAISRTFDDENGGFGGAPKFPQSPTLEFLLRFAAIHPDTEEGQRAEYMLCTTLERMARGGIYDHVMGGFARYSVDDTWTVPHFEKMLYDNSLLARIYLRTWQLTGDSRFLTTAREVLDYLDGPMADPRGGIHAAEDADSEGEEGRFAVWTWDELARLLNEDLPIAAAIYGFTPTGNFEGANNPVRTSDLTEVAAEFSLTSGELDLVRRRIDARLCTARKERVQPARDDKIVTAWNGFALRTFAEAAAVLGDDGYLGRARAIAEFIADVALDDKRLVRSWRGETSGEGFADDYAAVATGMYTLFAVTGDTRWFDLAELCVTNLRDRFADPAGGFFATADDAEKLLHRPKNQQDNPTPSDNALAMEALQFHAAYTGDALAIEEMTTTMQTLSAIALRYPAFAGHALGVWATHLAGVDEVAITGAGDLSPLERIVWGTYRPTAIIAIAREPVDQVPLLVNRFEPAPRAFVCHDLQCELPVSSAADLADLLN